ncbi:hypothetical protein J2783_001139 [Chryseobacterium sediminis]|nr:hypothetical protein [Chryseobacterium sediminis]
MLKASEYSEAFSFIYHLVLLKNLYPFSAEHSDLHAYYFFKITKPAMNQRKQAVIIL